MTDKKEFTMKNGLILIGTMLFLTTVFVIVLNHLSHISKENSIPIDDSIQKVLNDTLQINAGEIGKHKDTLYFDSFTCINNYCKLYKGNKVVREMPGGISPGPNEVFIFKQVTIGWTWMHVINYPSKETNFQATGYQKDPRNLKGGDTIMITNK
jgi:hypothetical protein